MMTPPRFKESLVRDLLASVITDDEPCAILAVRAYYRDSMGDRGENDVGIYDDAMFFVAPGVFARVNANTDPSKLGFNRGIGKNFAMLMPGLHYFVRGAHKGKSPALRQATEEEAVDAGIPDNGHFKVWRADDEREIRDGTARVDTGYFAINVHRGGDSTTSSWGCQTIPPDQFDNFMLTVWDETRRSKMARIPYLLIDGPVA